MSNTTTIYPVILCGGSGTRLWPLSRQSYPKQFSLRLKPVGLSLFQETVCRFEDSNFAKPLIVTSDDYRFIVSQQIAELERDPQSILIEPEAKNTAPAILAAALHIVKQDEDALIVAAPSDHAIEGAEYFRETIRRSLAAAVAGQIVTFGIVPSYPETGYGYLELAKTEGEYRQDEPRVLSRFVEKPDLIRAEEMVNSGQYLWNAGIFLFTAQTIVQAFQKYAPETFASVQASIDKAKNDLSFVRLDPDAWSNINVESIDYAIMERADNLSVMAYDGHWSDLGSWDAVWREKKRGDRENLIIGSVTEIDCKDSLLHCENESTHMVGIGLNNIVAVATADAVLVADKSKGQTVKEAVEILRAQNVKQADTFPKDYRPWGWFDSLIVGERFQVKRITVNPGGALSLQSHVHRAEHWIVVSGAAKVTVGDDVKLLAENQSVYIPQGSVHRLENPGKIPMTLIEVQTGAYLGEDDIVRYEDVYSRQ